MVPEHRLPERSGFGNQPDWLHDVVERYWLIPCSDALPEICHGLCNTLPAMFGAALVVGTVATLSYLCGPPAQIRLRSPPHMPHPSSAH